jgi:hypothetical protein
MTRAPDIAFSSRTLMTRTDLASLSSGESNPFAPPSSEACSAPDSASASETRLGVLAILLRTWGIFNERLQDCVGVCLACAPLDIVAAQGAMVLADSSKTWIAPVLGTIATGLGILAFVLFAVWVNLGVAIVQIEIARGKELDFGNVFCGGRFVFRALFATLIFALATCFPVLFITLVLAALLQILAGSPAAMTLTAVGGGVLGMIAGAIVPLRLSLFLLLILNRDVGAFESLRLSQLLTRGHTFHLFLLALCALGINLAGLAFFTVGLLFTAPFTVLLWVVTYLTLVTEPVAAAVTKGRPVVDPDLAAL